MQYLPLHEKIVALYCPYEKTAPPCLSMLSFADTQHVKLKKKKKLIEEGPKDKVILRINLMSKN